MISLSDSPLSNEFSMGQTRDQPQPTGNSRGSRLRCRAHGELATWLAASGGSLAITTYTSGKLVLVSSVDGKIRYRQRHFPRPMGIAIQKDRLAIATRTKILQFQSTSQNTSEDTPRLGISDACFTQRRESETGKLNAHELAFGRRGVYFANTRFNCIARVSREKKFVLVWQPPFMKEMVGQDRCHLNGLGMLEGRPAMATAFCETAHPGGWREEDRFTKGVLIDVRQNRVVLRGLCMPHSPRWHGGLWWLCNSGHGTLVTFDPSTNNCQEVCSLPGFTRGLCLVDNFALVGLSKIRHKHILDAPPVRKKHGRLFAGVALVDTKRGRQVGALEFTQGGREVFDVVFLPGIRRPNLVVN